MATGVNCREGVCVRKPAEEVADMEEPGEGNNSSVHFSKIPHHFTPGCTESENRNPEGDSEQVLLSGDQITLSH